MSSTESIRTDRPEVASDDHHHGCYFCFGGYVTITVEEDGAEHDEPMACRRCAVEKGEGRNTP